MPNLTRTCTVEECISTVHGYGYCVKHYKRWKKHGSPEGARRGKCEVCGEFFQANPTGAVPKTCTNCKPAGRTTCVGCGVEIGLTHRIGWHGSAPARKYCTDGCKPRCVIEGCERPKRKLDWCSNHYTIWKTTGDPETEPKYTWATERKCLTCGTTDPTLWGDLGRKFCSQTCKTTWWSYSGNIPKSFSCVVCGTEVPYFDEVTRKRLRSDVAYCAPHAKAARVYITAEQIAAEDGDDCKLCGGPVDFTIKAPDRLSPSRDHITPRALGGTDYRENLQLAHRGCNSAKRHLYIG